MSSEALSKMFNDCTESQVGQGSNPSQLRSALKKSKPESSVKQRFGHTQLAWLFDCQTRVDVPWNQGFNTFSYFHHLSLPEVWNMAYQVSGKKCQHIISNALSVPHVYRILQVQWCWWCLFWKWCLTVQCFSFATEGIQPCKPRCPKVNALVWILFGTLTMLISDLCIAEMRS